MATLRNLRNLLKANISEEHHVKVIRYLTSPRAVIGSKQFPFRYSIFKSTLSFPDSQCSLFNCIFSSFSSSAFL